MSKIVQLMFSSSFIVYGLTFRSLINFWFIFYKVLENVSSKDVNQDGNEKTCKKGTHSIFQK